MDFYDVIQIRRSVRSYQAKAVDEDVLGRVLNAGRLAPSGRNRQEIKLVVVRDTSVLAEIAEAAEQPWLATVPVLIAVVGLNPDRVMSCDVPSDPVDCAIAIDHMALAATAEGLGSCWIGHFSQEACCEILDVPPGAKIVELLVIGHSADPGGPKARRDLRELVSYDRFE